MNRILYLIAMTAVPSGLALAGPYYCYNPFFPGGGIYMWLTTLALFSLIIYLVYRSLKNSQLASGESPDAESILKKRLAKGEITEEEYDRLKSRISG